MPTDRVGLPPPTRPGAGGAAGMTGTTDTRVAARRARLVEELERVRRILAEDPDVLQLTVFGSLAAAAVHEWSDLDLVVVMRTGLGFVDRALELRRRLRPQVGVDLLVYTPEEWRELVTHRRFVRQEVVKGGRVVPLRPEQEAREWLAFAEDDLRVARLAMKEGVFAQVCFHAQQCTEKCLKALLTREGQLVPRTHKIGDLWRELPQAARDLLAPLEGEILELDGYYAVTRYPDAVSGTRPEGLPRHSHAEAALRVAEQCWQLTSDLVSR